MVMIKEYEHTEVFYLFIPLMIATSVGLWYTIRSLENISGTYIEKGKVESTGKVSLQYFLTYVIPFLAGNFLDVKDIAIYSVIFFIIGVIYVKSELIYMNPTLFLLGYNIFKVVTEDEQYTIITKNDNKKVLTNKVIEIGQGIFYERKTK